MTNMETSTYFLCTQCAHFVEENYSALLEPTAGYAEYVHLDDGEPEYDHDAVPGQSDTLAGWRRSRPELFGTYADGKIGPNSAYGPKR